MIMAETNGMEAERTMQRINEIKSRCFEKTNKNDKSLSKLTIKREREVTN
jgi:hypothetical protein